MDTRTLENLKVICRRNKYTYLLAKFLYLPVTAANHLSFRIKLSKKIRTTKKELMLMEPSNKRVFFVGVPTHENLGDAAQMMCIRRFIKENFKGWESFELESWPMHNKKIQLLLEEKVLPNNVFITESGATFSNRHEDHGMHRYLLKTFKNNRILFMPETVDLPEQKQMKITADLFNANPNAYFLARDPESYHMVENRFDNSRIYLCPDIVTTLIGNVRFKNDRDGIIICKRIDGEKKYTDSNMTKLVKKLEGLGRVDITDTNFDNSIEYTYSHLEDEIFKKLDLFSRYKVVLTDRYHGMIFSLISNTPVVVLPTTGHKVKVGALWFKEDYPDSIFYCETLDEAYDTINNIINKNLKVNNNSIYKEKYFENLLNKTCLKS